MRELLAFERAYRRRLAELDARLEQLRADRDEAMMRAYRAGIPIVEIAQVFTISHQRVSALVRRHKR
jgi:DNA-directed RNA polymerase specialized sigma24 family protein